MRILFLRYITFLLVILTFAIAVRADVSNLEIPPNGDLACPCLEASEVNLIYRDESDVPNIMKDYYNYLTDLSTNDNNLSLSTHGVGCDNHDDPIGYCTFQKNKCASIFPKRDACGLNWCSESWCYVNPNKCNLTNSVSGIYENEGAYSYATCGSFDHLKSLLDSQTLVGQTIKSAFTANSAGYKGAYNPSGSFAIDDQWSGPLVNFFEKVTLASGFNVDFVVPPSWIEEKAYEFYNNTSHFDHCFYAAELGYIDVCIGSFMNTKKRSISGSWFNLHDEPFYLVTFLERPKSKVERFWEDCKLLIEPFSTGTWLMIFFFVMPVMSLFMIYHEHLTEKERVLNMKEFGIVAVRYYYAVLLSFFTGGFEEDVATAAGKIHLLGISSFNMVIIAVFTANLAAILSTNDIFIAVDSLENVMIKKYNICTLRLTAEHLIVANPELKDFILLDPNDKEHGFKTNIGTDIIDLMKEFVPPDEGDIHCQVAVIAQEDIVGLQGSKKHCNKTIAGQSVATMRTGFPINPQIHSKLAPLLNNVMNDGIYDREISSRAPSNGCPDTGSGDVSFHMKISHLSGIFMVTFGFAFVALIVHQYEGRLEKINESND